MLTLKNRFYAKAALGHLHRTIAVREWMKLNDESTLCDTSLERVLGAFDMFLFQEKAGDFDDVGPSDKWHSTGLMFNRSRNLWTRLLP